MPEMGIWLSCGGREIQKPLCAYYDRNKVPNKEQVREKYRDCEKMSNRTLSALLILIQFPT